MSCCGQKREAAAGPARTTTSDPSIARPVKADVLRSSLAYFEYVGPTALTVQGPATGQWYRFDEPGAVVGVHPRDSRAIATLPRVRRVLAP
jgi:hypothetical protein